MTQMQHYERIAAVYSSSAPDDPQARAVLLNLAHRWNETTGEAWPAKERIAQDTGMAMATVRRALRRLEASGIIRPVRGLSGGRTSTRYAIEWGLLADQPAHSEPDQSEGVKTNPLTVSAQGDQSERPGGSERAPRGIRVSDERSSNDQGTVSEREPRPPAPAADAASTGSPARGAGKAPAPDDGGAGLAALPQQQRQASAPAPTVPREHDPIQTAYDLWSRHHPHAAPYPTEARQRRIKRALKETGLEGVELVMEYVHRPGSWWTAQKRDSLETILSWGATRSVTYTTLHEQAQEWARNGRRAEKRQQGRPCNGVGTGAWRQVLALVGRHGITDMPARWDEDERRDRALRKAAREVGGIAEVGRADRYRAQQLGPQFGAAFESALEEAS